MRSLGFFISAGDGLAERQIPARTAAQKNTVRRRLDDGVEEMFARACTTGDLEAAADLLAMLEKWHARRAFSIARERRARNDALRNARRQLDTLNRSRDLRAAGS